MKKLIAQIGVIISFCTLLQGCIFVAGAAAGAATIAIVYDHRTIANTIQDQKIASRVTERIRYIPELRDESHIEVTTFNRVVLLTGETPNAAWREEAEKQANTVPYIKRIYNQISVQGPASTLSRTSDYWITTKIKTQMLTMSGLKSGSIKVITEGGVVYLMGIVSREQADMAASVARQVAGVLRVVKIFQYTD